MPFPIHNGNGERIEISNNDLESIIKVGVDVRRALILSGMFDLSKGQTP